MTPLTTQTLFDPIINVPMKASAIMSRYFPSEYTETHRSLNEMKPVLSIDLGENRTLRTVVSSDINDDYINGLNDPEVHKYLDGPRLVRQTQKSVLEYVESNYKKEDSIVIGMFVLNRFVGTIQVHDISKENSHCFMGVAVFDKRQWGKGLASTSINAVATFLSEILKITRIEAGIDETNTGSQKAFQKAGFVPTPNVHTDSLGKAVQLWTFSTESRFNPK